MTTPVEETAPTVCACDCPVAPVLHVHVLHLVHGTGTVAHSMDEETLEAWRALWRPATPAEQKAWDE